VTVVADVLRASALTETIREAAVPLPGPAAEYEQLMNLIGDARIVRLGEAMPGCRASDLPETFPYGV